MNFAREGIPFILMAMALAAYQRGLEGRRHLICYAMKANSSLALREAALQGLGIARLPLFVAGPDLAANRLQRVLPGWALPEHGIHLVTSARGHQPRKVTAFADFLRARIGSPPYWEAGQPSR